MNSVTPEQQQLLDAEAKRRVQQALRQIEDAQNMLGHACSTLSSLNYAAPEWRATSKQYDRVKALWYKVRNGLQLGAKANKVCLDSINVEPFLRKSAEQRRVTKGDGDVNAGQRASAP